MQFCPQRTHLDFRPLYYSTTITKNQVFFLTKKDIFLFVFAAIREITNKRNEKTAACSATAFTSKLTDIANALLTDVLSVIGNQALRGRTENAGRLKLLKNDLIVIHKDLQFVTFRDIQSSADFDRQNDPSQFIDLTNDACGFHTQTNPFRMHNDLRNLS